MIRVSFVRSRSPTAERFSAIHVVRRIKSGSVEPYSPMDALTLFGLLSVSAMLVFYALEDRSPWFVLAFAAACAMGSVYGFLQGAWPFGVVEAAWTLIALKRWRDRVGTTPN